MKPATVRFRLGSERKETAPRLRTVLAPKGHGIARPRAFRTSRLRALNTRPAVLSSTPAAPGTPHAAPGTLTPYEAVPDALSTPRDRLRGIASIEYCARFAACRAVRPTGRFLLGFVGRSDRRQFEPYPVDKIGPPSRIVAEPARRAGSQRSEK